MSIYAIILSGGHGTRLWPASRPTRPKQFLPLLNEQSMFQATVERMAIATDARTPIVVAGEHHAEEISRQLQAMGREAVVLIEPEGRDSGPALAAAAAWIAREDADGVGVMVASDHHLPDAQAFRAATLIAAEAALTGAIVTFGIAPSSPSEAYGYICVGEPISPGSIARRVNAFVEKPSAALARTYVQDGYLWNSGNFVFRAQSLLDELERYAPDVLGPVLASVASLTSRRGVHRLGAEFKSAPKISIDYAVMEKTEHAFVVPLDLAWSDLGAWDAVLAASPRDGHGNAVVGDAVLFDSRNCLIRSNTKQTVAALGLSNIGVIVEDDAVLVCELSASQGVKQVVDRLQREAKAKGAALAATPGDSAESRLTSAATELSAWLRTSALPLWWTLGADHERGGFHEALDMQGAPAPQPRRARVQARQTYVFAMAGLAGWAGPWRGAVQHGLDYLQSKYLQRDGGFRTLVSPDGAPADETVMLYDQAFVLLALATAKRAELPGDQEAIARTLMHEVIKPRLGPHGGYREMSAARPWQSNPHMHLLEACLAWEAVSDASLWREQADMIAELALGRFIDGRTGALREFFESDWSPAVGPAGRIVEPGHQFEWAWLLTRWGQARDRGDALAAAAKMFQIGASHGVDHTRGVAVNALFDDFALADANARLWPQTERLKAALLLSGRVEGAARSYLLQDAAEAAAALSRYLATPVKGLWRDNLQADGMFTPQTAPASSLYHIVAAIAELEAWSTASRRPASADRSPLPEVAATSA